MSIIAILADIHGNLPALEAIVADMQHRQSEFVSVPYDHECCSPGTA